MSRRLAFSDPVVSSEAHLVSLSLTRAGVGVSWNSAFGQLGEQFSWLLPWVSLLRHSEANIRIEDLLQVPPPLFLAPPSAARRPQRLR